VDRGSTILILTQILETTEVKRKDRDMLKEFKEFGMRGNVVDIEKGLR
jgi:hypothetical protein